MTCAKSEAKKVGQEFTSNSLVRKVSFTGSTAIGKIILEQSASTVKRVSMELGGNAPFIVFNDADIDSAVQGAIASKFRHSGQTCVCVNRFLVQAEVYESFCDAIVKKMKETLHMGNGFEEGITQGPLIHGKAIEKVKAHVADAVSKNATILLGGNAAPHIGENFFEPTVLSNMDTSMNLTHEETFGPIAAVYKFSAVDEAIKLANETESGLVGYFYSRDVAKCKKSTECSA